MENTQKLSGPTPEEMAQRLRKAKLDHEQRAAIDPEYKKQWEDMEKALFPWEVKATGKE